MCQRDGCAEVVSPCREGGPQGNGSAEGRPPHKIYEFLSQNGTISCTLAHFFKVHNDWYCDGKGTTETDSTETASNN